ncbi:MAG: adenylate/guanylate cyclase domain-containing protein [Acidimicrobiales bacterium]|nr:adenylate/guanylate cyclase domain-containing protein [Acidimicrobiales bacterium]
MTDRDTIDAELEAAGLLDPTAPGAAGRRELLAYLLDQGCSIDELVAADAAGRLTAAAADAHLRRHQTPVDAVTVAGLAAVDPASIAPAWRAIGFADPPPDAELWWPSDAPTFAAFDQAAAIFGAERLAQFSRALGRAAAQVAEAAVAMFVVDVQATLEAEGRPPVELAQANLTAQLAADAIPGVFESAFRHHLEAAQRRLDATTFTAGRDRALLSVGFADLVGSTELAHRLDPAGTARLAADLERVATDAVARADGRLVKTIGDGILFTTPDTASALAIATELTTWAAGDERLDGLRVGLASGPVVWQEGDVHGPVVNLAARLCAAADGGQVLVEAGFAAAHGDADPRLSPVGEVTLRGFATPVLVSTLALQVGSVRPGHDDTAG